MSCILNSDLLSCLKLLPDNTFDGVFCDPPYELGFMGKSWDSAGVAFQPETWAEVLCVCKPGAHLLAFGGSRTFHRLVCAVEDAGWEIRDVLMWVYGSGFPKSLNLNDEWQGYGTALKPAYEPIVLARKPLDGTVAHNVQKWGCGALWIDGGRVPVSEDDDIHAKNPHTMGGFGHGNAAVYGDSAGAPAYDPAQGRWPANVLHEGLPEEWVRYFYCAKASQKERDAGCEGRNVHPTVKPLDLCRYLATLILPPADRPQGPRRLLVPFSGSGSEMIGALMAGWDDVTGIEREAEYVEIAKARLSHHSGKPPVVLLPEWLDL